MAKANLSIDPLDQLSFKYGDYILYKAGLPGFPRTFMRDGVLSALLSGNAMMLENKLKFAASIQGVKKDPRTGEQPGIIFHEYDTELNDGVELSQSPGLTTKFNASDTTALYLIAHEEYQKLTGNRHLSDAQKENIKMAAEYILMHLDENNIFIEDPRFSDAQKYALKVTYWKDSILLDRTNGEPIYPVKYPLVQIQNLAGLRAASHLLMSEDLYKRAEEMRKSIPLLFDKEMGNFPIAIDGNGEIKAISSDGLEALFYLNPQDISPKMIKEIVQSSVVLETPLGYRVLDPKDAARVPDAYHARTLWTHEQALIHKGAVKHLEWAKKIEDEELVMVLNHVKEVSFRVTNYLFSYEGSYPELFIIDNQTMKPGKNDPQLWAIAAYQYFKTWQKSGKKSRLKGILGLVPIYNVIHKNKKTIERFYLTRVSVGYVAPKIRAGIKSFSNYIGKYADPTFRSGLFRKYIH